MMTLFGRGGRSAFLVLKETELVPNAEVLEQFRL
jgi:hypothetical protein